MATSPVLYVYYPPLNDDSYPGVPSRHITEADGASVTIAQRRAIESATTQEGYTRRKVWVHRDLVDETEQERADREAAEQAARDAYERGQSIVRWRDFEPLVPGPGMVAVGSTNGVQQLPTSLVSLAAQPVVTVRDRFMAANGTALDAHIPEIGQAWTAYTTGKLQVQGGGATGPTTGGMSVAVQPAVGKNVRVRARAVVSATGGVGVVIRAVDSANFMFAWVEMGSKALRIYGVTEGTTTLLATTPAATLAAGQTILMDVTASGGFVQLTVPGHGSIQWEAVHDGTGVGLRMPAANAALRVVSFEVEAITDPVVPRLPSLTAT